MSDYVNTVSLIGDQALTDSILDGSVSELVDDCATTIKGGLLAGKPLKRLVLRSVTAFPNNHGMFGYCTSLKEVEFPSLAGELVQSSFQYCTALEYIDAGNAYSIGQWVFYQCNALKTLLLRRTGSICLMPYTNASLRSAANVYVPSALIEEYESATNWSAHSNFRALEDYTVDGTVTGALTMVFYACSLKLTRVSTTNQNTEIGPRYHATLSSVTDNPIEEVSITMGGVDITAEAYNAETGEINISLVTGDLVITASAAASGGSGDYPTPAFEIRGSDFVNDGNPTALNGMTLSGFDYTETSGSDGQGNIVTSGKERVIVPASMVTGAITFAEGFTIAFKTTVTNTAQVQKYMLQLGMGAQQASVIYGYVSQKFELYFDFASSFRSGSQITVSDNEEHIIAYTHDGSTVCCYLDGSLVNSYSCAFDWSTKYPNSDSYILGSANTNNCYIGKTANLAIWNKALTAEEVSNLFAGNQTPTVAFEYGDINYETAVETDSTARFRTDFIPYNASDNTFHADTQLNGGTENAGIVLRPYDSNYNHLLGTYGGAFRNFVSDPVFTGSWASLGITYTLKFGDDVAFVRAVYGNTTGSVASSLSGTITVSGVEYELVQED